MRLPRVDGADAAALASLVLLALLLLWPAVVRGEVFFERDVHSVWHAQVEAFARSVSAGSWPVWDPSIAFGQPLLANPNNQVFYPPHWTSLILAPWTQYTFFAAVHLIFAGTGLFLLARRYGCSRAAATTAAAVWVGSGPLLSLLNVWHHFAGATWLPWVVLAAERALDGRHPLGWLLWGAAVALQLIAGSPDMLVLTNLLVAGIFIARLDLLHPTAPVNRGRLGTAVVAGLFALALSAAQWMPTLEVVLGANRAAMSAADRAIWAIHPWRLGQVLVPLDFEMLPGVAPELMAPLQDVWQTFVRSIYLGAAAVGLVAAGALAADRRRLRWLLALAAGGTLVYIVGSHTPVHGWATELLPPLAILRYPSKFAIALAFCWALLSGLGLDALGGATPRVRRAAGVMVLSASLACLAVLALSLESAGAPVAAARLAAESAVPLSAAALLAAGAAALLLLPGGWSRTRSLIMAALAVADLVVCNRGLNPTTGKELFRYRPEILDVVGVDPRTRIYVFDYVAQLPGKATTGMLSTFVQVPGEWPRRVEQALALQTYLLPPIAGRWGLSGSFDRDLLGLYPKPLREVTEGLRVAEETPAFGRLLRIGGVDFVVALHEKGLEELEPVATIDGLYPRPIRIYRVPGALPRAYAVAAAERLDGIEALRRLAAPGFDASATVILADGDPGARPAGPAGQVEVEELAPDRVRLEARLDEPGFVVLLDSHDPGWRVSVDGQPAELLRANVAFRAVAVPAGEHAVEFVYRPASLRAGLALSCAAAVGGLAFALHRSRSA